MIHAQNVGSLLKEMTRKDLIKYLKHWRQTMRPEECSAATNMAAKCWGGCEKSQFFHILYFSVLCEIIII